MTKLLQNKFAVAFLLAVAIGLAAVQFDLFTGSGPLLVAGREAEGEATDEGEDVETVMATNLPPRYLTELRDWQQMLLNQPLRRDPFQPPPLQTKDPATSVPSAQGRTSFRLQAISRHEQRRYAVVDGSVVGEGDRIAEFKVVHIDAHGLLLRGQDGTEKRLQLNFDTDTTPADQGGAENAPVDPSEAAEIEPQ